MSEASVTNCIAFIGERCIASGSLREVAAEIKGAVEPQDLVGVLVFDGSNSQVIELDLRGSLEEVLQRLPLPGVDSAETPKPEPSKKRGRPKLGVVAREVTLLPRHWEWLASQPGGASVALRKLVEQARRKNSHRDEARRAQESCYRFMSAMTGNLPGFEEAVRALFAGEAEIFRREIAGWPGDIRLHCEKLAQAAFTNTRSAGCAGEEE